MNTKNYLKVSAGALALVMSFAPFVALAEDDVQVGLGAQAQVGDTVHATAGAQGDLRVRSENEGDVQENNSDANENDREDGATSSDVRQDGEHRSFESQSQDHGDRGDRENGDSNHGDEMRIEHSDVFASTTASSSVDRPQLVHNRGELRSFLEHLVKDDERIANVAVSSTSVATTYALPAKFLGFIPTGLSTNVMVNNNGTVTVTYPWYAFLFKKSGDELKAQLEQAASTSASSTTTLDASTEAHLLNSLFTTLKASVN